MMMRENDQQMMWEAEAERIGRGKKRNGERVGICERGREYVLRVR